MWRTRPYLNINNYYQYINWPGTVPSRHITFSKLAGVLKNAAWHTPSEGATSFRNTCCFERMLLWLQHQDGMHNHCHIGTSSRDRMVGFKCGRSSARLPKRRDNATMGMERTDYSSLALGIWLRRVSLLPALRASSTHCPLTSLVGHIVSLPRLPRYVVNIIWAAAKLRQVRPLFLSFRILCDILCLVITVWDTY